MSGSLAVMRRIISLRAGSPGTIASSFPQVLLGSRLGVEAQLRQAVLAVGAVAGEAIVRQDRPDVAVELNDIDSRQRQREEKKGYTQLPDRACEHLGEFYPTVSGTVNVRRIHCGRLAKLACAFFCGSLLPRPLTEKVRPDSTLRTKL